jgi:pseudaminic acid cytidylyltransferase
MNIAVIPARGGSKRIPRKNIKLFNGLPVIAYAIRAAKESGVFSEIVVSTEDEEIAEVATSFGAAIPWMRPKNLSEDNSTTVSVMQDAVMKLKSCFDELEYVCCIYPATPLLQPRVYP